MSSNSKKSEDRINQAEQIVDRQLGDGEQDRPLDEGMLIEHHPGLEAELATQLQRLRIIEDAQHLAMSTVGLTPSQIAATDNDGNETGNETGNEIGKKTGKMTGNVRSFSASPNKADNDESVRVPGYDIVRRVSRGGQGVVYEAIQLRTSRRVAIKFMRAGHFSGDSERARFDREVRVLAALRHPSIVTIHDSGVTADGHYFVMDLIDGKPLDVFFNIAGTDDFIPSLEQTLTLFLKICRAVDQAHLRGVIHRDLKCSNILVDDECEPHVLDFGLAKLSGEIGDGPIDREAVTITGQFVGSLPWASPEQVSGRPELLDIRTDVYSLGVILYQLLTRQFPYPVIGNVRDVMDNILEQQPDSPARLNREVNAEVATVVLKCLEKDADRRYQSAGDLARDIERYLKGEPVHARAVSTVYLLKKTLYRHRAAAAIAGAFLVLLAGFAISMSVLYRRSSIEATKAHQVQEFLQSMLSSVDPSVARGRDATVLKEMLSDAARRIESGAIEEPQVEAALRTTIGLTYHSLGSYEEAEHHLQLAFELRRNALGADHDDTLVAENNLAIVLDSRGFHERAQAICRRVRSIQEERFGPTDLRTLSTIANLALTLDRAGSLEEAEKLGRLVATNRVRQLGENHNVTLHSINNLAGTLRKRGKLREAEILFMSVHTRRKELLGEDHPSTLRSMQNVSVTLERAGRFDEAKELAYRVFELRQKVMGPEHPDTLWTMNSLAVISKRQGNLKEACELNRKNLEIRQRVLGEEHAHTLISMINLANTLREMGQLEEATQWHQQALEIRLRTSGELHPDTLMTINNLAVTHHRRRQYDEAERLYRRAMEGQKQVLGERHPETLRTIDNIAVIHGVRREYEEAAELHEFALKTRREVLGDRHPHVLTSIYNLASLYDRWGRFEDAVPLFRQALDGRRSVLGTDNPETARAAASLALTLARLGHHDEAESLHAESYAVRKQVLGSSHLSTLWSMEQYAGMLARNGRNEEAIKLYLESIEIRTADRGREERRTVTAMERLGSLYAKLSREGDARHWLEQVVAIRTARADNVDALPADLNTAAWMLLTCQLKALRDPVAATNYAEQAVSLTSRTNASFLDTLALAHKMSGRIADAIEIQREAISVLPGRANIREPYERRLAEYRALLNP